MAKKYKKNKRGWAPSQKAKKSRCVKKGSSLKDILDQAMALHEVGRLHEARVLYNKILVTDPNNHEALYFLGMIAFQLGKNALAIEMISKAITKCPDFINAHFGLGIVLKAQGNLNEALKSFQKVLTLLPDDDEILKNLGYEFLLQGKLDEAATAYRRVLTLQPNDEVVLNNLGVILKDQGRLNESVDCFRRALSNKPNYVEALSNLGNTLIDQDHVDEAIDSFRKAIAINLEFTAAHDKLLFCMNYSASYSGADYLKAARQYGRIITTKVSKHFSDWNCSPKPKRLCVGMVSGDLGNHVVALFLENLLANLDRNKIDLIAYPTLNRNDAVTARLKPYFTEWNSLVGIQDEAAARLIHADGVHILIDLSGHTDHNRLPVFAWKPAPVQVTWLGYSASTGLSEMDYLLADSNVVPTFEEKNYTETIWRLPECYMCFSQPKVKVDVGPLPVLKKGQITFGSFNNLSKMNDSVVALWAEILHAIPESRLMLKAKKFSEPTICANTHQRFSACGIAPERIVLLGHVRNREEHLAIYNLVDIALDPFPYNGTTTSIESLWMGVPFITGPGDRFISRVGQSIANNAGLTDWIAEDHEDYVNKAVTHVSDLKKLSRLRGILRKQVETSPLFNASLFARNFEAAMFGMWYRFQNKQEA